MLETSERSLGCCPPPHPHHCPTHGGVTTGDWMQYINTYMDVRARQIYDKLKGLLPGGDATVKKIFAGTPNVKITPESGTGEVYIGVDDNGGVKSISTNSDNVHITPSTGKGDVIIDVDKEPKIKDYVIIKDGITGDLYKLMVNRGDICTEEYES